MTQSTNKTNMTTMMLVAHALPVELRIAQKTGTRFRAMAILRVGGALALGWLLNFSYQLSGTLQQPNRALWSPPGTQDRRNQTLRAG